jgi:hypothetical protein
MYFYNNKLYYNLIFNLLDTIYKINNSADPTYILKIDSFLSIFNGKY